MENSLVIGSILMTHELRKSLLVAFKAIPADWESYFSFDINTKEVNLRFNEDYTSWLPTTNLAYCSPYDLILVVIGAFNIAYKAKEK